MQKFFLKYIVFAGLCFMGLFIATSTAYAELPFITDDPSVVDVNHGEFYLYSSTYRNETGSSIFFPAAQISYGVIKHVEIEIIAGILTNQPKSVFSNATGFTDVQLGLKYEFLEETTYLPAMAIGPNYFLPTGNAGRGLGNGRSWFFLPLLIEKSFGKWTTYGSVGWVYNNAKFQKDYWFGGLVLLKQLNDKLSLGAEIYSQTSPTVVNKAFTLVDVGGFYFFTKDFSLLFSAGPAIIGPNNFYSFLGFQWTW